VKDSRCSAALATNPVAASQRQIARISPLC
jgi:hypothetical protein